MPNPKDQQRKSETNGMLASCQEFGKSWLLSKKIH
uniref:Uncharacterized protein n=1 Tax=Arundo donax TaxID=35708 RepID=A0A0A9HBT4_ARUDO